MATAKSIEEKLTAAFKPERLVVIDESHLHAGHRPEFDGSGGTHFRIRIVAEAFAGVSRIDRHRAISDLLKPEMADEGLHALAIEPAAPGEAVRW